MRNILIVGAGISGCTMANLLSDIEDIQITIMDEREYLGGNCNDDSTIEGIRYHRHGPHIFHTKHKEVYDYVKRFTDIIDYTHKVVSVVDNKFVPVPINQTTLDMLNVDLDGAKDILYKPYTIKQWGFYNEDALKRIKLSNESGEYFPNQYQGLITDFVSMFRKMIDKENIELKLGQKFIMSDELINNYDLIFYCGSLDELFDYSLGHLPYRSLSFEHELLMIDSYLFEEYPVINYPSEKVDYTRITEQKRLTRQTVEQKTLITKEYPEEFVPNKNERYYPINNEESNNLWQQYKEKLPKNIIPLGRLGEFKYKDMDVSILDCFEIRNLIK